MKEKGGTQTGTFSSFKGNTENMAQRRSPGGKTFQEKGKSHRKASKTKKIKREGKKGIFVKKKMVKAKEMQFCSCLEHRREQMQ